MKTPIATLLERAAVALPPQCPSRAKWSPFYCVVVQLMTNGHNVLSATDWLILEGAIAKENRQKAYRSLLALHNRHEAKAKKQVPAAK